jgi:hypothetical protein
MKKCPKCKSRKGRNSFNENSSRADGLQAYCKDCTAKINKKYHKNNREKLRRKAYQYNIKLYWPNLTKTEAHKEYIRLRQLQQNRCAICLKISKGKRLHIDHNHNTGKVRGLLCNKCNRGLGYFNDSEYNLHEAIKYLQTARGFLKRPTS